MKCCRAPEKPSTPKAFSNVFLSAQAAPEQACAVFSSATGLVFSSATSPVFSSAAFERQNGSRASLCGVFEHPSGSQAGLCNVFERPSDSQAGLCSVFERSNGSRAGLYCVLSNFLVSSRPRARKLLTSPSPLDLHRNMCVNIYIHYTNVLSRCIPTHTHTRPRSK